MERQNVVLIKKNYKINIRLSSLTLDVSLICNKKEIRRFMEFSENAFVTLFVKTFLLLKKQMKSLI